MVDKYATLISQTDNVSQYYLSSISSYTAPESHAYYQPAPFCSRKSVYTCSSFSGSGSSWWCSRIWHKLTTSRNGNGKCCASIYTQPSISVPILLSYASNPNSTTKTSLHFAYIKKNHFCLKRLC